LSIWTTSVQPELGQMVDQAVADDAGADDDAAGLGGDGGHEAPSISEIVAYYAI
jgi:hypothetical protein